MSKEKIVGFSQIQDGRINLISQEAELNYCKEILTKCPERATDKTSEDKNIQVSEENKDESDSVCTYWKRQQMHNTVYQSRRTPSLLLH